MGENILNPSVLITPPSKGNHPKIFLGVISLLILTVFSISGYLLFNKLNTPKVVEEKQLTTLTTNLLQAASRANQASSQQQKDEITKQLVEVAKERKVAALKQMEEKPEEFLRVALPEKITSTLPAEVQQEVEQELDLEGTLEILHADNFEQKTSKNYYSIVTEDKKRFSLTFADKEPGLIPKAKVKIKGGVKLEDKIVVPTTKEENFQIIKQESNVLQAATPTVKKIAVILFNFQDNTSQPVTEEQIRAVLFSNRDSVNNYYKEVTFDKWSLAGMLRPDGDIFGWYTILRNKLTNVECRNVFSLNAVADLADQAASEAARAAGINLDDYSNYIYVLPSICINLSTINGRRSWISENDFSTAIIAHELGHNFGMDHAISYRCLDANGRKVAISSNCAEYSYRGDPFGIMGNLFNGNNHINNFNKGKLEVLNPENTFNVTSNGIYTISPIEQASSGIQSLRIFRGMLPGLIAATPYYYLEYRRPYGIFDAFDTSDPVVNGVSIRMASDYGTFSESKYIDTTPNSRLGDLDWYDAALAEGKEFYDPIAGVTIKTLSVESDRATVQVTFGQQVCVRANPTLTITDLVQWGTLGQDLYYHGTITNNDSLICPPSGFNIARTTPLPSGWTGNTVAPFTLAPGASFGPFSLNIKSSYNAQLGFYPFTYTVTNTADSRYTASATVNYNIGLVEIGEPPVLNPTPTPTPIVTPIPTLTPTPTPTGNIGVGPTAPLSPGACSVDIKAKYSNILDFLPIDGPLTILDGFSAALSWTSSGDIDGILGGQGPNGNPFSGKTLSANGSDTTGVLSIGTYTFGVSCQGTNLVVNSDYVTINVISEATPTPVATVAPTQTPLATPVPTLSPISCGSSYFCRNNVTGNICGGVSIFTNACSLNAPCDCGGAGTITQCLNSGVNCPGAPVTPTPAPICPYGVDHYSIAVYCSSLGGGSETFSTDNPNECANYPIGGACSPGAPPGTVTQCTISPVCATQPSPTATPAKVVTGITINGQAVNLASPTLNLHLPGTPGQAGVITVPMVVTYSDNTTSTSTLTFNYVPPAPSPTAVPTVAPTAVPLPTSGQATPTPAPAGPDTTPPTASITSPGSGATVTGTTAINVDASDNVGISKVEYRIDNVLLINDKTAPYSANWNSTTYANGSHTILVRAYDLANNRKEAVVTVNISN